MSSGGGRRRRSKEEQKEGRDEGGVGNGEKGAMRRFREDGLGVSEVAFVAQLISAEPGGATGSASQSPPLRNGDSIT